jgi:Protein of unknown function (DUF1501)
MFPTRRKFLEQSGCGFGMLAASALLATNSSRSTASSLVTQIVPRAKRVIFLFMQGGISQVDSFDYKPLLQKQDGQMIGFDDARVLANTGKRGSTHRVMQSPWRFRAYGESGHKVSDLFPNIGQRVDDLCFIHSMHTEGVAHGPATLFMHCGSTNMIRPSIGSWVLYGLGSENENLPGFVSITPSIGNGGARNYGNAFLPARAQGTAIGRASEKSDQLAMKDLDEHLTTLEDRHRRLRLVQEINESQLRNRAMDSELDAATESFELAWRMQTQAPDVFDLNRESEATLKMYGIGSAPTDAFGRKCLLARRLCESGVRFVQVNYGDDSANPAWDQHSNLPKHEDHARAVDRPVAGLLADLKQRGLLEDTIVWFGSEFGRTPYAEKNGTGRDHNPGGFTVWLAGGGVKPGMTFGKTDEFGHHGIQDKVYMHDLHATILHLLGVDHEQLTYRYSGRDFRLTDVYGRVVHDVLS